MKNNFYNDYLSHYNTLINRKETLLDAFIYYQLFKAQELGVTEFTDDMNIAFTKILNKCIDFNERGKSYDFKADVNMVLINEIKPKTLVLRSNK